MAQATTHFEIPASTKKWSTIFMVIGAIAAIFAKVPVADTGNLITGLQLVALQKVNGYSQQAERDADGAGFELTRLAGFNPVGALTFMERLARDQRNFS